MWSHRNVAHGRGCSGAGHGNGPPRRGPLDHDGRVVGEPPVRDARRRATRPPRRPGWRRAGRRAAGRRPGRPAPARTAAAGRGPHLRAGQVDRRDVASQHRRGPPVALDEQHVRGAARQRLQPERTRARAQVEHRGAVQPGVVRERGEQRLPHPVGGRPGARRRHGQPPPARRTGHDPRHGGIVPAPPLLAARPPQAAARPSTVGRLLLQLQQQVAALHLLHLADGQPLRPCPPAAR